MTDPNIKVSVVIPIYNQEHYLRACLDSLLEQTFTSFEVLAVNDGSTDASAAIVQEYERRDPRFHLIDKPNGGVSAARNTGIAHACGQWIGFIDPDDYVAVDYLQVLYDAATSSDDLPDIVMSTCIACDGARKSRQHFFPEPFTACTPREEAAVPPVARRFLSAEQRVCDCYWSTVGKAVSPLVYHCKQSPFRSAIDPYGRQPVQYPSVPRCSTNHVLGLCRILLSRQRPAFIPIAAFCKAPIIMRLTNAAHCLKHMDYLMMRTSTVHGTPNRSICIFRS